MYNKIEEEFIEKLADIEHQRWADWQIWCHQVFKDGKFKDFMQRWERQIKTPYAELPEEEKEKDREQVRRYLPLLRQKFEEYREEMVKDFEGIKSMDRKMLSIDEVIEILKGK